MEAKFSLEINHLLRPYKLEHNRASDEKIPTTRTNYMDHSPREGTFASKVLEAATVGALCEGLTLPDSFGGRLGFRVL